MKDTQQINRLWERLHSDEPYFIAEIGVNYNNDLTLANRIIAAAAEAGADAVKFQSYKASTLCTRSAPRFWDWEGEEDPDGSQFDSYARLDSFGEREHVTLRTMCLEHGVEFMSTPFDHDAVDYLDRVGINAYKIASCDITNHDLLEHVAKKERIVMLSTGAANMREIVDAVKCIRNFTDKIVVMHCNLKYPTDPEEINLGMLEHMQNVLGRECVLGLSDHTRHWITPALAYMKGARVFERHFTVDKELGKSADHWLSADGEELAGIIRYTRLARTMHGTGIKACTPGEQRAKMYARRSVVTTAEIRKGERLTHDKIACKRPGTGIPANDLRNMHRYIARRDIAADEVLQYDDLEKSV